MIVSQTQFMKLTSIDNETLSLWLEEEWLLPEGLPEELYFSDLDIARAHLILSLSGELGVNREGTGIILHLIDQVHSFRNAVSASVNSSDLTL